MILSKSCLLSIIIYGLLPVVISEVNGPSYDTSDWIPIVPETTESTNRESKSSDRILNIGISGEKFIEDGKLPYKKSYITPHKPRKNPHIKRSPNQRTRIKLEQPYRFENILSPPPKQQVRGFQQKVPYQQNFNFQPQQQYNIPKPSHIVQQQFQQFPAPSNPFIYNLNNIQAGPSIPNYHPTQLGVSYQQPNVIHTVPSNNNTIFANSVPATSSVHQGLFETSAGVSPAQNVKLPAKVPSEEKDSVQLLYVPLEQLQKQQGIDSGILDEAFKSLQQQRLVAPPPATAPTQKETVSQHQPRQKETELIQQSFGQNLNEQLYLTQQGQQSINEEKRVPQQYYILQNNPSEKQPELPRFYELVSKNQGELILQNKPKTVEVSSKQEYQVQAEKQQIIELTTPQPLLNHQSNYNSPFANYNKPRHQGKLREQHFEDSRIQGTRNFITKDPQREQSYVVQNQVSQPFSVEAPKLQQSYIVRNEPQAQQLIKQDSLQDSFKADQNLRLQSIQKDILQQTLQVEKLQKQIQQGKSIDFQGKNNSQPQKKRKPHQPPLAVYMESNKPGDVEAVLEVLKNAKSIAVQDQVGPNSPQVFIGPSNLSVPEGFAKFPLPYLSNLDNNRIQRKAQQFPFFVAPINYKEPEGYSKIPLPSPHVGSVVVSQFKQKQLPHLNNEFEDNIRPITNYKFVNPSFESVLDGNSHFDTNFNAYSLENGNPRDNLNKQLKEQTLLQQITGFSGLEYPQGQYFNQGGSTALGQEQESISASPIPPNDQFLQEVHHKSEKDFSDDSTPSTPQRSASPSSGRQRTRGERIRGNKKGSNIQKESNIPERSEKTTEQNLLDQKLTLPEVPTPNVVRAPEKVEISSQNPLTQDFLNRFSSNNNFNFNYVSSTPGYAIPTQGSVEELPANIAKLNVKSTQETPVNINQQTIDAQFEQSIQNLQNSKERVPTTQEERRVHIHNQYEQFELPSQLSDINPNLPGLINELEQQNQFTTAKYQPIPPISTTRSTTEYTIRTTEATTTPTTTTKRLRGRGRSRFNMKTTTSTPYRRNPGERRRPSKTTTAAPSETSYVAERTRSRSRLQNSLTERVAEGSIESTSSSQQLLQPSTIVMDISQKQPNYFVEFQSSVDNAKPILRDYVEEPKTETVRFVEQYQSQKVTPAEELASHDREQYPLHQMNVPHSEREEPSNAVTQKPSEEERSTRKRVRVRGRPKNKYSSTTLAPRQTTTTEKEENEFYGFFRQPNFSQSSQISNNNRNEEENIHIYAPTQQKTPIYTQRNEPAGPISETSDSENHRFVGELRPKYASPSRGTTTPIPETTQRGRIRGRVRVPGRSYESRSTTSDGSSTERSLRGRVRGRTHFTPPRNTRDDTENNETENYPAPFLKNRATATTPSSSAFKITVSVDDEKEDQNSQYAYDKSEGESDGEKNKFGKANEGSKNSVYNDRNQASDDKKEILSFRDKPREDFVKREGFRVVNLDQFDTAESQNYRSHFNSLDSPYKVNDLKSKEIEESSVEAVNTMSPSESETTTVPTKIGTDRTEEDSVTSTDIAANQITTIDDLNSTILKSVRETIGNSTMFFFPTTTAQPTLETTTDNLVKEILNTDSDESTEEKSITTSIPDDEFKTSTANEPKIVEQTPLDLLNLQTSTSTEVSHETEICFKGRCVKSRNKKFRKRLIRKKVNETNF